MKKTMKLLTVTIFAVSIGITANAQTYTAQYFNVVAGSSYGIKFWNGSSNYQIKMGNSSEFKYGPVQDYSIKTTMYRSSSYPNRGWTWGVNGQIPVASIRTDGAMQLAHSLKIGSTLREATLSIRYTNSSIPGIFIDGNTKDIGYEGNLEIGHWNGSTWSEKMRIQSNGNTGIGISNPGEKLDVSGNIMLSGSSRVIKVRSTSSTYGNNLTIESANNTYSAGTSGKLILRTPTPPGNYGAGGIYIYTGNGNYNQGNIVLAHDGSNPIGGNVGIGTNTPTHLLTVKGTIKAEEIIVDDVAADYVFEENYQLRSLAEVENFIKVYGHLPDLPPATETIKGVKLGEFSETLLQKIEELTLYVIELKNENEKLKNDIDALK